jgi:hypothetical protein
MDLREFFSPFAVFLGVFGLAGVLATWLVMVRSWRLLPATVAHHFDLLGRPDSFGAKRMLWVLPVLAVALYVALLALGLWGCSRRGDVIDRTRLNVETFMGAIAYGTWMIFFVTRGTIDVALGRRKDLGRWSCPTILGVLAVLILVGSLRLR